MHLHFRAGFILERILMENFFIRKSLGKFFRQKLFWSCSKLAQIQFRVNKFQIFWNIRDYFENVKKNPIASLKFGQISNLKSDFYELFRKKSWMFKKNLKFIYSEPHLSQFRARSEHLLFRKKKYSVVVWIWKTKIKKSQTFPTWNRIFLIFSQKKPKFSKIFEIYLLWTLSEPIFSKIREPFSGGSSLPLLARCLLGLGRRGQGYSTPSVLSFFLSFFSVSFFKGLSCFLSQFWARSEDLFFRKKKPL